MCYISKKIENSLVGNILRFVGEESFYIMGLHFLSFKLLTFILNYCGNDLPLADLTPAVKDNFILLFMYALFGLFIPVLFVISFRKIKNGLTCRIKN